MDGTLAVIWLMVSLTDMKTNDCDQGCLAETAATARLSFQAADVIFQSETIGQEVLVGYDSARQFGPFQLTYAASMTDEGAAWIGAGAKWTTQNIIDSPLFLESSFLPGLYAPGDGPNLGGALHFRSAIGAGYELPNGSTVTISYDHRSNGDIRPRNPGLETLSLRYAHRW